MIKPNYVLVLDTKKTPLTPCKPSMAKKLLDAGKAAVYRQFPFTIILKKECVEHGRSKIELKIDPGSKTTGLALINNDCVVWVGELNHRGSLIKKKLESRRNCRRQRRSRLRYRSARFLNRTKPKGWLAPSLKHRVLTIMTWERAIY